MISHLENYISRYIEKLTQYVSLDVLAKEHRRKHHNCVPILAVDGLNVLRPIFRDLQHRYCGGQWSEYVRRMKAFVHKLRSIGIEMIFYFDGSFREMTEGEVESRDRTAGFRMATLFQYYRKEASAGSIRPLLPGEPSFFRYLLKYECECKVHIALTDLHQEVALYAKRTLECFGILADDTEYMIFETKPLILAKSLDLTTLRSAILLRKEFLVLTGLENGHLPLLGCMIGNNILPAELLNSFHTRLSPQYSSKEKYLVQKAIGMIRQYGWPSNLSRDLLNHIAQIMFIDTRLLETGIDYYKLTRRTSFLENRTYESLDTVLSLRERCFLCKLPSTIFTLYTERKARYGISVEDPYDEDMPASAVIYRLVRQRIYSIMFGGREVEIREWCVHKNKNALGPEVVRCVPVVIDGVIPRFEDVLYGNVDQEFSWKLFVKCLGISIPLEELVKTDPHFIAMCCILNIMIHCDELQFKDWEVKSFICQAVLPQVENIDYFAKIEDRIDPRAASLLGIALRGLSILLKALAVCGLPFPMKEAMPWKWMEGKVFHFCYNVFKEYPDSANIAKHLRGYYNAGAINKFRRLYVIVTTGTKYH